MRFINFFLACMVQKYQNERAPIFYYGNSPKNSKKDQKVAGLQLLDWIQPYWMSRYMSGTEWPRVFPNHPPQRRHTRPHHQRRHEQSAGGSSGEKWGYGGTAAVMRAWISSVSVAIICSNYFAGQYFDCDTFFEKGEKNMSKNHAYLLKPSTAFY